MSHHFRIFLLCFLLCPLTGCGDGGGEQVLGAGATGSSTKFGETDLTPFLRAVERHPEGVKLHLTPHSDWMNPVAGFIQESGVAERRLVHAGKTVEKARATEFVWDWSPSGERAELTFHLAPEARAQFVEALEPNKESRRQSALSQGILYAGVGIPSISFQSAIVKITDKNSGSGSATFQTLTLGNDEATQNWLTRARVGSLSTALMSAQASSSALFSGGKPSTVGATVSTTSEQVQILSLGLTFENVTFSQPAGGLTVWDVDENYQISYGIVGSKIQLKFVLKNGFDGWMGVAFHQFFFPADTIIVWWDAQTNSPVVWDAYNPGIPTLPNFPAPLRDDNPILGVPGASPYDNQQNVQIVSANRSGDTITIVCERDLDTQDLYDYRFQLGTSFAVWAGYNENLTFVNEFNAQQPFYTKQAGQTWRL